MREPLSASLSLFDYSSESRNSVIFQKYQNIVVNEVKRTVRIHIHVYGRARDQVFLPLRVTDRPTSGTGCLVSNPSLICSGKWPY